MVSLKVEEDHELNIVFVVVTWIFARRHFWGYKLGPWCFGFGFGLVFRVRDQSFKVEDLRTICLRKILENALEKNNLISAVMIFRLSSYVFVIF